MKPQPVVSVIIPARNEESNIESCLKSVLGQQGIEFEVIVVDDASTDRTAEIAKKHNGVRVISARPLENGWTGKSNAICTGVSVARGQWYLFTDADTEHQPGSLRGSLAEAQARRAILLSYSPKQITGGWWDKLVQPLIFADLNKRFDYKSVSDPKSSVAAANGQYMLFERVAYQRIGGHAAVRGSLLEDVDLALLAKQSGRIWFRYAPDAVTCRMYRSFAGLREGWTKNLAILFPNCRILAVQRSLEFLLLTTGPIASVDLIIRGNIASGVALLALAVCTLINFAKRLRQGGFGWSSTISVLGLPIYVYLLVRSLRKKKVGGISWKGRTYSPSRQLKNAAGS
jgi:glycosyltransferase involved in cell wall biosynthesis